MLPRIKTYVDELDEAMGGGIPVGHHFLLTGPLGTGKTALSYSILHNNAVVANLNSLFVSFTMPETRIRQMAGNMSMNPDETKKRLHVVDRNTLMGFIQSYGVSQTSLINIIKVKAQAMKEQGGCSIVVVDNLQAMKTLLELRTFLAEFLKILDLMDKLNLAAIFIHEGTDKNIYSQDHEEMYLDGCIETGVIQTADDEGNPMHEVNARVVRMTASNHKRAWFPLRFSAMARPEPAAVIALPSLHDPDAEAFIAPQATGESATEQAEVSTGPAAGHPAVGQSAAAQGSHGAQAGHAPAAQAAHGQGQKDGHRAVEARDKGKDQRIVHKVADAKEKGKDQKAVQKPKSDASQVQPEAHAGNQRSL